MNAYEDFLDLSVGTLRDYLNLRGLQVTGRKVELVARAFSACEMNLPIKLTHEQHNNKLKAEYNNRLAKCDLADPNSETEWLDDMTLWPAVDLGKIFAFILLHKEFDTTYIGKYKDRKAYSYWKSNFVGSVLYSKNKDDKCILKSSITPSQRVRQDPHQVNFAVQSGYTDPSCTSVPCGWNQSTRKDVEAQKILEMNIRKDKASGKHREKGIITKEWKTFDPRKEGQQEITYDDKDRFINGLKEIYPRAQILKSMELKLHDQPKKQLYITECAARFLNTLGGTATEQEKIYVFFFKTLPLSDQEVLDIEKETKGQASCKPYIGASPDGLLSCKCCGQSVVEIKCPFSIRDSSVTEWWQPTDFLERRNNTIQLKREHKYYYQVNGEMAVTGALRCYLLVWTPKELHVEVIKFDTGLWESALMKLDLFFKSYMAKVLLGLHVIYFCPTCEKVILEGKELPNYSPDNSICCDRFSSWFHFKCAQVRSIDEDQEWFCSACLQDLMSENLNLIEIDD
ncbi:hypothetical protein AC249_AIPGENE12226 [Exaiptasia diaphana]|nr:hypothetical protein AC249_AIPGENE12226 [Exaiptasia diaphana]